MKKKLFLLPLMLLGLMFSLQSCDPTEEEACESDVFCEINNVDQEITICCTGDDCVWKYDGKEYADTQAGTDELYNALGCTAKKSSENYEQDYAEFMGRLYALKEDAIMSQEF